MRRWSLHPRHLDSRGLIALWREGLLAQKVLAGEMKGYRNHTQLKRFRAQPDSVATIASYLHAVCNEADVRGYRFDRTKLTRRRPTTASIEVTDGQMHYELVHLLAKLETRDPNRFNSIPTLDLPDPHPYFVIVPGPITSWERPLAKS